MMERKVRAGIVADGGRNGGRAEEKNEPIETALVFPSEERIASFVCKPRGSSWRQVEIGYLQSRWKKQRRVSFKHAQ